MQNLVPVVRFSLVLTKVGIFSSEVYHDTRVFPCAKLYLETVVTVLSDVDGRRVLRQIFRKWEGIVGTGCSWLRIGTGGGRL